MEGFALVRKLTEALEETASGSFMNSRTSYDYLYSAVQDFNFRTHYLTNTQVINITANNSEYPLNPDFVSLALLDRFNQPFVKWTYGGQDSFVYPRDYSSVVLENSTAMATIATSLSIVDASQPDNITGTASADSAAVNGECTLSGSSDFSTVSPGDYVHNTTQRTDSVS